MNKLLMIFALFLFFLSGCGDNDSVNDSEEEVEIEGKENDSVIAQVKQLTHDEFFQMVCSDDQKNLYESLCQKDEVNKEEGIKIK